MKQICWTIVTILILIALTGCVEVSSSITSTQDPLVGNWMAEEPLTGFQEILTIQPDNTIYVSNSLGRGVFSYELTEGKIHLTDLETGKEATPDFEILGDYKAIKFRGVTYYPYD